jgi:membrane-associated phospholipid phosphatase
MKIKVISLYLKGITLFWTIGIFLVASTDKIQFHKKLNGCNNLFIDLVAPVATNVGDGLFAVFIGLIFLFIELRASLLILISFLISAGITQFLKHLVFSDEFRPMHYFGSDKNFHLIEGLEYHLNNSFPSGHSTTCFALFTMLAIYFSSRKMLQLFFVFSAILFAFTRVYLSQHFFEDILAGSFVGTFSSVVVWLLLDDKLKHWDKSILTLIKKSDITS